MAVLEMMAVGVALTRAAVRELNAKVGRALAAKGVPVVLLSPADAGWMTAGRGEHLVCDGERVTSRLAALLARGRVPLLHGDIVEDFHMPPRLAGTPLATVTVLSGDTVLRDVALALRADAAVTASDVPGLLSAPPGEEGSELVRRVRVGRGLAAAVGEPEGHDVTGGMAGKLGVLSELARAAEGPTLVALAGVDGGPSSAFAALAAALAAGGDVAAVRATLITKT